MAAIFMTAFESQWAWKHKLIFSIHPRGFQNPKKNRNRIYTMSSYRELLVCNSNPSLPMTNLKMLRYACLSLFCSSPLLAQKQWESSFSAEKDENDSDPTYGIQIIRNNAPVTFGSNVPWNETAFVDKIGFLEASFSFLDTSRPAEVIIFQRNPPITFDPGIELDTESENYFVGYTHRQSNSRHAFSASCNYRELRAETLNYSFVWNGGDWGLEPPDVSYIKNEHEEHIFNYTAGYDYYLTEKWTIGAEARLNETKYTDAYQYSLTSRGIWELGQDWIVLNGALSWSELIYFDVDLDGYWTLDLEATYYFTPKTGVGIGTKFNPEGGFEDIHTLSLDHHFTKSFNAEAAIEYHRFDTLPGYDDDQFNYTLRLGYRF